MKNKTFWLLLLFVGMSSIWGQDIASESEYLLEEADRYLYGPNHTWKKSKNHFKSLKNLANTGNAKAHYYVRLYKKEGLGTPKNIRKSKRSFLKAYELGSGEAAYAIGYYHLKGFGDLPQDYAKAYHWFKKSGVPMGTHWMAKMQFLGLGRTTNKKKALKLLLNNNLYNSAVLALQYQDTEPLATAISERFAALAAKPLDALHGLAHWHKTPVAASLAGEWEGEYLELDWSKQHIFRSLPIHLALEANSNDTDGFSTRLQLGDSVGTATSSYSAGSLRFTNLQVPIKKQYTDYPSFTHLMVAVKGLELREVVHNGERFLLGRLDADYPVWQERANPGLVLLQRKKGSHAQAQAAFLEQANDFIRLFPNPFEDFLMVNFELPLAADVKVEINHYYNTPIYQQTVFEGPKAKGKHTLEVYNPPTHSGTYLVSITYNGIRETKIILKN